MILVTGGLGFIGSHTVRALLDRGVPCVAGQHRSPEVAPFLLTEVGHHLAVEPLDVNQWETWAAIFRRHPIDGIVHLAGSGTPGSLDDLRVNLNSLGTLNLLEAARQWRVPRVVVASTIGVYIGVLQDGPVLQEEMPLPLVGHHGIETAKKIDELLGSLSARALGINVIHARIAGIWGPLGRVRARFFQVPQLVHAALRPDMAADEATVYADDAGDLCYVKDCAQALALLATIPDPAHRLYNVGGGRAVRNADVVAAIRKAVPEARLALTPGRSPGSSGEPVFMDITRIRTDTGYTPAYDLDRGVADYVAWLRAGHAR